MSGSKGQRPFKNSLLPSFLVAAQGRARIFACFVVSSFMNLRPHLVEIVPCESNDIKLKSRFVTLVIKVKTYCLVKNIFQALAWLKQSAFNRSVGITYI